MRKRKTIKSFCNNCGILFEYIDDYRKNERKFCNRKCSASNALKNINDNTLRGDNDDDAYPKHRSGVIRLTAFFLNLPTHEINYGHVRSVKEYIIIKYHNENLSLEEIGRSLGYTKKGFRDVVKTLGIQAKTASERAVLRCEKNRARGIPCIQQNYIYRCRFRFDAYKKQVLGYKLMEKYRFGNKDNEIQKDHMVSILYGWNNNIDPRVISHPANCCILFAKNNREKNGKCSITLDQLYERISKWN